MSDPELSALLDEVDFTTPARTMKTESHSASRSNVLKSSSLTSDTKSNFSSRRVLIGSNENKSTLALDTILDSDQGRSSPSSDFSMVDDVPSKEATGTSNSNNLKTYKLLRVVEPNEICGRYMTQGVAFCTEKDCMTNHRNMSEATLEEGQLYVMKTKTLAFSTPVMDLTSLENDILSKWLKE